MNFIKSIVLGFIAGAIAMATLGELTSWLFFHYWTGWNRPAWSMDPVTIAQQYEIVVPRVVRTILYGAIWGAIFGAILGSRPQGMMTIRGAILGLFGPAIVGALIAVPLLTERYPPFFGGDVSRIVPLLVVYAVFGAVTAWLYGLFRYGRLPL